MADIQPFTGLRYNTEIVGDLSSVTTPPYDVISPDDQERFYHMHPFNVIRLELGKETPDDNENQNKYTRAADFLNEWIESGVLKFEDKESLYIYGQDFTTPDGRQLSCKGLVCLVKLEEFEKGIILPHEETLSKAKSDRMNLLQATHTNFSAIYSLYMDQDHEITPVLNTCSAADPDISFVADDGVTQKLWVVSDEDIISRICSAFQTKQLFIADGHHRYETALQFASKQHALGTYSDHEKFDYVMMFLADIEEDGLLVLPTHRMLHNLDMFQEQTLIERAEQNFTVQKHYILEEDIAHSIESKIAGQDKAFGLYTGADYFYTLTLKDIQAQRDALPEKSDAYNNLDVAVLHTLIIEQILGIGQNDMRGGEYITYTRDSAEAVHAVQNGGFQCSFFLNPTKISDIKAVSLENEKMPQKSTYFYPKLTTGVVMNDFDE